MDRDDFFQALWDDFVTIAPHAAAIRSKLVARGENVQNDHVAFRTFDRAPLSLERLEPLILSLGYHTLDEYHFAEKHLRARAYLCEGSPRIFLSELLVDELGSHARATVERCVTQAASLPVDSPAVFWAGRPWPPLRFAEYEALARESEYAAWLCALGLHANHFTISVNTLKELSTIPLVLDFVESSGYAINTSGGRVKGSPAEYLEQGSTLADRVPTAFADGVHTIPTCYYEFALRYPTSEGALYQGFVPQSADKIFESTHRDATD